MTLALLLAACASTQDLCATGNRLTLGSPQLRNALASRLRHAGIEFVETSDGVICYPPEARQMVASEVIAADLALNPPNSIRLIGGDFAERVLARLRDANIEFTRSEDDGYVVILITREEEVATAMDMAEEVAHIMWGEGSE